MTMLISRKIRTISLAVTSVLALASVAGAHTSYMKPSYFSSSRAEVITLQSAFTEDFSNPEVAVQSQDWRFFYPDGSAAHYDKIVSLKQLTVLEQKLGADGTYRFSTGERLGRKGRMYRMPDGSLKPMFNESREKNPQPEGATVVTTQTATVADVYVTKGAPTQAAVDTRIGRLRIEPVTHPSEIYLDEGFTFHLTFDGKPLAGHAMELSREGGAYDDNKGKRQITTGPDGDTTLTFDKPGVYLLMTRQRADAPEGSESDLRSYTTSITFEVMP